MEEKLGWLTYKTQIYIDKLLSFGSVIFFLWWIIQSIHALITTMNLFCAVHLWFGFFTISMHATTALSISTLYLFHFFLFRTFLPGHFRVLKSALFTCIGIFFYDTVWSTCNFIINGYGSFLLPMTSTIATFYFLWLANKEYRIIHINKYAFSIMLIIYILTLIWLLSSGYFQIWALYEKGLAPDPHSYPWLINKVVCLWMWVFLAER